MFDLKITWQILKILLPVLPIYGIMVILYYKEFGKK